MEHAVGSRATRAMTESLDGLLLWIIHYPAGEILVFDIGPASMRHNRQCSSKRWSIGRILHFEFTEWEDLKAR